MHFLEYFFCFQFLNSVKAKKKKLQDAVHTIGHKNVTYESALLFVHGR